MLQDTIFVFGSNKAGRHGKGAAKHAVQFYGAIYGQGEGLQGRSYALPTKDGHLNALSLAEVKAGVQRLLAFAADNRDLTFQVTRVGCGLAQMKDEEIFPLFRNAPSNCILPGIWEAKRSGVQRLLIDGSRHFDNYDLLYEQADKTISAWGLRSTDVEIVYPVAGGAPALAARYAAERGLSKQPFEAEWNRLGKNAGIVCNTSMAWYATHALIFWDGVSGEAKHMFDTAKGSRLRAEQVLFTPEQQPAVRIKSKSMELAEQSTPPSESSAL